MASMVTVAAYCACLSSIIASSFTLFLALSGPFAFPHLPVTLSIFVLSSTVLIFYLVKFYLKLPMKLPMKEREVKKDEEEEEDDDPICCFCLKATTKAKPINNRYYTGKDGKMASLSHKQMFTMMEKWWMAQEGFELFELLFFEVIIRTRKSGPGGRESKNLYQIGVPNLCIKSGAVTQEQWKLISLGPFLNMQKRYKDTLLATFIWTRLTLTVYTYFCSHFLLRVVKSYF